MLYTRPLAALKILLACALPTMGVVTIEPAQAIAADNVSDVEGTPSTTTPYALDPLPHGIATLGIYSTLFIFQNVVRQTLRGGPVCGTPSVPTRCDPSRLNALDRTVVGNDSEFWRRSSDVTAGLLILGATVGSVIDNMQAANGKPWGGDLLRDLVVMGEATALSMTAVYLLKLAVRRPRPSHYTPDQSITTIEQQLGFPSGHAGFAGAMAMSYATTFHFRHPDSPYRFVVDGAAAALVLLTSYGRVGGGRHFYSDVVAGMLIGGTSGFVVPYLYRKRAEPGTSAGVRIRPYASPLGVGFGGEF